MPHYLIILNLTRGVRKLYESKYKVETFASTEILQRDFNLTRNKFKASEPNQIHPIHLLFKVKELTRAIVYRFRHITNRIVCVELNSVLFFPCLKL